MDGKLMQRLTLGISCVALFAAVGGPSYARDLTLNKLKIDDGKISGSAIKSRSLPASKLTKAALSSLKGNAGAAGPAGPVNLRYVAGTTTSIGGAGGAQIVTATCPTGLYPISGGVYQFAGNFDTLITYKDGNGWSSYVQNTGQTTGPVTPFAVCISATSVG